MNTVNVQIDISGPAGKKLLREIEKNPDIAKIEYPSSMDISAKKTYTVEEVFSKVEEKLNIHYGSDIKLKYCYADV